MMVGNIWGSLIEKNLITNQQLENAFQLKEKEKHISLKDILISQKYLEEKKFLKIIESEFGIPYIDLSRKKPPTASLLSIIPSHMAIKYQVLPIKVENKTLTIAIGDPLNSEIINELRLLTGHSIKAVSAEKMEIEKRINRYYRLQEKMNRLVNKFEQKDKEYITANESVVELLNQIIENGVHHGASDIHLEPQGEVFRVRFRLDGILHTEIELIKSLQSAITNRLKILVDLDLAEKKAPQEGHFQVEVDGRTIDLRISIIPTFHGEKTVIGVLDQGREVHPVEEIGLSVEDTQLLRSVYRKETGLLLFTGPTGSGKTSTIYSIINELNTSEVNIVTIEDPIEYQIAGVNQTQVNESKGLTFAKGLKALFRQDPNILVIGEMRDVETAGIGVKAALAGHLVLSTLHTKDAISTITRLLEMGIESYYLAASISAILSQRLVRKVCKSCAYEAVPSTEENALLHKHSIHLETITKGKGCFDCSYTGYKGRTVIGELIIMDDQLKEMISTNSSEDSYREYLVQRNHSTILKEGLKKVEQGITTIPEVLMVV